MLKFLQRLALDVPYICLTDKCIRKFKKVVLGLLAHVTPSVFFSVESLVVKL